VTRDESSVIVENRSAGDRVVHLSVSGEIDMETVDALRDALMATITAGEAAAVVVDFAEVSFCDSSGVHALDAAYGAATERGIAFEVINLQPPVRRVLELVGILAELTNPQQTSPGWTG
jgi:anti-anti-sigma factor